MPSCYRSDCNQSPLQARCSLGRSPQSSISSPSCKVKRARSSSPPRSTNTVKARYTETRYNGFPLQRRMRHSRSSTAGRKARSGISSSSTLRMMRSMQMNQVCSTGCYQRGRLRSKTIPVKVGNVSDSVSQHCSVAIPAGPKRGKF